MARRNWGKLEPERPREYRDTIDYEDGTSEPVEYYQGADPEHAIAVTNPDTAPCFYVYRLVDKGGAHHPAKWVLDHENPVEPHDAMEIQRRRKLIREHFVLYQTNKSRGERGTLGMLAYQVYADLAKPERDAGAPPAYDYQPAPIVREPVERIKTNKTRFFGVSFNI